MYFSRTNKIIILFLFLLVNIFTAKAEDFPNSAYVEQRSYHLYMEKEWDELISFTKEALKQDYDYYYLRLRVGIAYFEKQNYLVAEKHFKKALAFNSSSAIAEEYVYYCYLHTGRYEEARWLSKKSTELSRKLNTDSLPKMGFVIIEGGIKASDSSNIFKNATYFHLGLSHYIKKRFSLFNAATYFSQVEGAGKTSQFQYYLKSNIPLKRNWSISPGVHWINKKFYAVNVPKGQGRPLRSLRLKAKSSNYFVGSLSISKTIKKWNLSIENSVSNINDETQIQHGATLSYFVFGNSKLVLGCTGIAHTTDSYSTTYMAVSPFIVVRAGKRITLSANYLNNAGTNVAEANGYILNNSADLTTSRWTVIAGVNLGKHVDLYGLYQYEYKQQFAHLFNYHYNGGALGIKIIP